MFSRVVARKYIDATHKDWGKLLKEHDLLNKERGGNVKKTDQKNSPKPRP